MNDGITRAILNAGGLSSGNTQQPQIKLLEIPSALQKQNVISGEVISNKDGKVTLSTPQGNVVFEADVQLQIGQKITLKLQVMVQNAEQNIYVELTSVTSGDATTKPAPIAPQPIPQKVPDITLSDLMHDYVAEVDNRFDTYPALPVRPVKLPAVLSQDAMQLLMKEILNFPVGQKLPPPLEEGVQTIQALLPVLAKLTATTPTVGDISLSAQDAVKAVMQFLQQVQKPSVQNATVIDSWPTQPLALLQTIMPGQKITPEIIGIIQRALQSLQPSSVPNAPQTILSQPTVQPQPGIMPPAIVMQDVSPDMPSLPSQQISNMPVPILSLVLGQKNIPQQGAAMPVAQTLMLGFVPSGEQILMFVMPKPEGQKTYLPGTVLATIAPQPNVQNIPLLPATQILTGIQQAEQIWLQPMQLKIGDAWPALEELWQTVLNNAVAHPEAMAAMRHAVPSPTVQNLTPVALFFMAALKLGTPEHWIGEKAVETLRLLGKADVINQLARDIQTARNSLFDPAPADTWRPLPMPIQLGDELGRLQWFYRHQYEDQGSSGQGDAEDMKKRTTRFIVDVPKTRLGDIQIDGLMKERNLDLILRTEQTLALYMEGAIRDRYQKALEISGIQGSIGFQHGRNVYVNP